MRYKLWTREELEGIKHLQMTDTDGINKAAERMNRTYASVYSHLWKLSKGFKRKRKLPKTAKPASRKDRPSGLTYAEGKPKPAPLQGKVKVTSECVIITQFSELTLNDGVLKIKL